MAAHRSILCRHAPNLTSAARSVVPARTRRYATGIPALPAQTLNEALARQDPLRRIRFLPQNEAVQLQDPRSPAFGSRSWFRPFGQEELNNIHPDLFEIKAHLLPFWTVMYIGDIRKRAWNPRAQTGQQLTGYGFATGVAIAAVPVGHWSSGVVLPDHLGHLTLGAIDTGRLPEITPDIYTQGSPPFLESPLWDAERAPLFAFGAPKAQRIAGSLVQCQAKNTRWDDGTRDPELCSPVGEVLSYAVPTYRPVFRGLTLDGSTIFIDSAGIIPDINRFKVEGECTIPHKANMPGPDHPTVIGYFTRAHKASDHYEERTPLNHVTMYDYRRPDKTMALARLLTTETQRTPLQWDDPFIISANKSVYDDAVDVWSYGMKRAMKEPVGKPPKGPSLRSSADDMALVVLRPPTPPPPRQAPVSPPPPRTLLPPPPRPPPSQTRSKPSSPSPSPSPKKPKPPPITPRPPFKQPKPAPTTPKLDAPPPQTQPTPTPIADPLNYYLALKISPQSQYLDPAHNDQITAVLKSAVRTLRERYHPDRQPPEMRGSMTERSQQVAEAFEELNTLEKRIRYSEKS